MKFSIIIPCYKVERYLRQCVDSVLSQTFEDYEIILVDDGSPDETPIICDEYAVLNNKVRVIHKKNGGLSDARNAGLEMALGDYVMFLDSDDWWDDKEALRKVNDKIIESGAEIIIFGIKKYFCQDNRYGDVRIPFKSDKDSSTLSRTQVMEQFMQNNIFVASACDKIVRRDLIENDKQRFVKHQLSEDIEWCCKLLLKDPLVDILEEGFYVYRQQVSTSISSNIGTKNIRDILDVVSRYAKISFPVSLLHFIANQYVLLITNLMRLSQKEERKKFDKEIKDLWWLLKYNWYPYVRMVSKVEIFGYNLTKHLLGIYFNYKSRR